METRSFLFPYKNFSISKSRQQIKLTLHIIYDEKYFPLHMLLLFPQT